MKLTSSYTIGSKSLVKELDSTAISFLFKAGSGAEAGSGVEADSVAELGSAAFTAEDMVVGVQSTLPMESVVILLYVMGADDDDVDGFCRGRMLVLNLRPESYSIYKPFLHQTASCGFSIVWGIWGLDGCKIAFEVLLKCGMGGEWVLLLLVFNISRDALLFRRGLFEVGWHFELFRNTRIAHGELQV